MHLDSLLASSIDDRFKGIPGGTPAFPLAEVGRQGWNVLRGDLPFPLAVLRRSALEHNGAWMRRFLERFGAWIAPHGKTTMSPQLFAMQMEDGAWGITVATAHQLQVCRRFGVRRVVMANQLVDRQAIRYVLDELHRDPDFDFFCLVDSVAGVRMLAEAAREHPLSRPVQVLLEGGFAGGRTGCRDLACALEVAEEVRRAGPHLALRGVEGFEGLIPGAEPEETEARVREFLEFLLEVARECDRRDLFAPGPVLLSAGGSAFYDLVAERFAGAGLGREFRVLLRSGCYLTQDARMYRVAFRRLVQRTPEAAELGEGLRDALEVWALVQSLPEPGRAILTLGKRDAGSDAGLPEPLRWHRSGEHEAPLPLEGEHRITGLNDQHAFLQLPPDSPLRVGDRVVCGVSHPCTTFDRWQLLFVVDDDYDVVSAVRTFF